MFCYMQTAELDLQLIGFIKLLSKNAVLQSEKKNVHIYVFNQHMLLHI